MRKFQMAPGLLLLVSCLLLFAVACARSAKIEPPEIAYGHDMCDVCGMLIGEPPFAAALLLNDGTTLKFDDLGEMFAYHQKNPDRQVRAWFVHDYESEVWLRGEEAFYVVSAQLQTPMGFGMAAFAEKSAAEKFAAQRQTQVLTFDQARALTLRGKHKM